MEIFLNGKSFRYPIEVELLSKVDKKLCNPLKEKRNVKALLSLYLNQDLQNLITEFPTELRVFHIENWNDYEQYWVKKQTLEKLKYIEPKIKTDNFIISNKRDFKKLLKNISSYKWSLNPYTFEFVFTLSPADFKYNEVWNDNL